MATTTERLYQFDTKATSDTADIIFCGNSLDTYNEVQTTVAGVIGAYPGLLSIGSLTTAANQMIYTTAEDVYATTSLTAFGRTTVGLAGVNNSVLVTNGSAVPSLSTTLPTGLAMQTPASIVLTNATGLPVPGGLTATGTPSPTTFLRGDGTWAIPAGTSTVNAGLINQAAYYAAAGTTVSGAANVLMQNSVANLQITRPTPASSGVLQYLNVTAVADTGLTASTEVMTSSFVGATKTWATGALTLQRETNFGQPTYAFAGASTITDAATVYIAGAVIKGTNATITNSHGLYIAGGSNLNAVTGAYGLTVNMPTGIVSANFAVAQFRGLSGACRGVAIGTGSPIASLHITRDTASSSGVLPYLLIATTADTGGTASTECPVLSINGQNKTWAAGAITTQRSNLFSQPTYAFASASTITDAANIGIVGAPVAGTNATITNSHGLLISTGNVAAGSTNSYGVSVNAMTGASANYAAQFIGGNSGFGVAAPAAMVHILKTTEQLRVAYDGSNYYSTTVGSTGIVTFDAAGTSPAFQFNDAVRFSFSTLTDAATIAVNLAASNNFNLTLGGNRTLGVPTNPVAGQSGVISVRQDITGSRTLAYAWPYMFVGGSAPILSTGKLVLDQLMYIVNSYSTSTVTITIASPGVVTWTAHGLVSGQRVQFTTTGALPTGLSVATTYWVTVIDANTFNVSTSLANAQAATFVDTSGTQSGVHTAVNLSITITFNPGVS